jgi:hypothetical protein
VAAIAKGLVFAVFAATPSDFFALSDFCAHRPQAGAGMGTITIGLVLRLATGTPEIAAGLHIQNIRGFLGDFGCGHGGLRLIFTGNIDSISVSLRLLRDKLRSQLDLALISL